MGTVPKYFRRSATVALTLACLGLPAAGCGSSDADADSAGDGGRPVVVATTGIVADIVAEVGGDRIEVSQLVPDGAGPHSYSPSAKEQQAVAEADLLVLFSPALEQALPLDAAERSFAIADPAADDPHIWLDPTLLAAALPGLATALSEVDPEGAPGYERRAGSYAAELDSLDAEIERTLEVIPAANRKLVTSHDLMGYFADRYDFEVVGAPFGIAPEAEAAAGELAELIAEIEADGVPAVFAQQGDDPEVLRRVAEEADVEIVDDLLLESLSAEADSYAEMMRFSVGRIAEALAGPGQGG